MTNLNRRDFIKLLGAGAVSLAVPACTTIRTQMADTAQGQKPNIIFIMTDDQGPWAYHAFPNPNARTPNIDRLCREGATLKNYFCMSAVCSPSRACLITSRYSTETGITDYIKPGSSIGLDTKFPTWPRILADHGYATALVGKWHLGSEDKFYPTNYGYEEFVGFRAGGAISKDPKVEINRNIRKVHGYTPDILTNYAIDFIRRKKNGPFLLSLHFWAPHANTKNRTPDGDRTWLPLSDADWNQFKNVDPVIPNPDYPKLDIPRVKRMMREYLASVASVDRNLGRLLAVLDELRLADNTIVVFTSDNGYNMGHNGIWHKGNGRWILTDKRGSRPNLYDNSLRVPAIVRWPGIIKPGTELQQTITNFDWFPTLLAVAGIQTPKAEIIRGRNFLPLLKGKSLKWDNDLFAQYSMRGGGDMRTYRTERWKLIRNFSYKDRDELYDLAHDPEEHNNLIDSPEANIQKMRKLLNKKLLRKMAEINDPALAHVEGRNKT